MFSELLEDLFTVLGVTAGEQETDDGTAVLCVDNLGEGLERAAY